jgi:dihydrofolate reductase
VTRKITANISITLDGVMQAPARPDEDTRGGFSHGGWAVPYNDPVMMQAMADGMAEGAAKGGALLFGRRTYEDFFSVWPKRGNNPFTEVLNRSQKYVASQTLTAPLPWENSTLLAGDAATSVAQLKQTPGVDMMVLGSGNLLATLMAQDLVDTFVLLIHPLALGGGHRLFRADAHSFPLQLIKSVPTTKGVIIATYERR